MDYVAEDVYKTDIMETGIIIAACIVAYFLQLNMGAVLGSDQNKYLKIGDGINAISGIGSAGDSDIHLLGLVPRSGS